jgi:signal transduction histidine kinase
MTPAEWMPASLKAMQEFASIGRTIPYEKELYRRNGTRWWGMFAASRLTEDEGVEYVIDVTERKAAEAELRASREDLELRVQERTAELDAVNGALRDEIVERERAEQTRQELMRQLVVAQEDERRRISRELHDEVGQDLTALLLGLRSLQGEHGEGKRRTLEQLQRITERIGKEVHEMALKLRPTALDDLGLLRTLSNYVDEWAGRSGVEVDFHSSGWSGERLPSHLETTIYRIVQEALNNVLKHAKATQVSVIVERRTDQVIAIVEDNGVGFDIASVEKNKGAKRLGLLGMTERAALIGGQFSIESSEQRGTTVFVRIPL